MVVAMILDLRDCWLDKFNSPDITLLKLASKTVGNALKKNDIVIYESTVYPGCTEEDCVPVLESTSKLKFNKDYLFLSILVFDCILRFLRIF